MGPFIYYLDYLRILLALTMLVYGSYIDLKTREIHDLLWLVFGGVGLLLDVYELFLGTLTLRQLTISVGFMVLIMAVLGFFRLFGEADLFAFIVLSFLHPKAPEYLLTTWGWSPPLFSFSLLSNSAIAGILPPLVIFSKNLISKLRGVDLFQGHPDLSFWRKLVLLFTGISLESSKIMGAPFHYPLETEDMKLRLRPDIWNDDDANFVLAILKRRKDRVWVSVTLPYLIVMTVGYILTMVFGDILLWMFILFL